MTTKRDALFKGFAEMFEVPSVGPDFVLSPWDSLNIMQTVVLIDDVYGKVVHGRALADCTTVEDILKLAEAA